MGCRCRFGCARAALPRRACWLLGFFRRLDKTRLGLFTYGFNGLRRDLIAIMLRLHRLRLLPTSFIRSARLLPPTFITTGILSILPILVAGLLFLRLATLGNLTLCFVDQPDVMFRVLLEIFRRDPITCQCTIMGKGLVLFYHLRRCSTNTALWPSTVINAVERVSRIVATTIVLVARARFVR